MATDYDASRKTEEEQNEESLEARRLATGEQDKTSGKVDEDEMSSDGAGGSSATRGGGMKSEFRRVQSGSELPRNTAHFLPTSIEEEEEDEDEDSTRAAHVRRFSIPQSVSSADGGYRCSALVRALS